MKQESLFPQSVALTLTSLDWQGLCSALPEGTSVLTANKRLARSLLEQYAEAQRAQELTVWPRVDILPWQSWCRRVLELPLDEYVPHVLSAHQSERLWRQIIQSEPVDLGQDRVQPAPAQCVKPAAEAWALLKSYGVSTSTVADQPDVEAALLCRWGALYEQRLLALNAIDQSMLADELIVRFEQQQRELPQQLILAGFHEIPPDLERLLRQLNEQGCELFALAKPAQKSKAVQVSTADAEAEARVAAMWAREQIAQGETQSIALVVVDLAERRAMIERVFNEALHPEQLIDGINEQQRAFNISLGWPLADEPLIHDALLALRWVQEPLDFDDLSQLLRSPFWSADEAAAAQLELRLRSLNMARASLQQVLHQAGGQDPAPWRSASWAGRWRQFRQQLRSAPAKQSPLAWASLIAKSLTELGLGQADEQQSSKQRRLSSREYQAFTAFHECLEQLAALDPVMPQCSYGQILHELQQLASGQIFQPQQDPAPILITEPLQALGLNFDAIWLMGATDENWPAPAKPNALLPHAIQREFNMPHATAAGELKFVQTVTQWLLHSAKQVICSWPRLNGDQWLRPSSLIAHLPDKNQQADHWLQHALKLRRDSEGFAQAHCENYHDEALPALEPAAGKTTIPVSGGAGLIREQSACPFRALVAYRWQLKVPARVVGGLTAAQRGILLHSSLQALYVQSEGKLPEHSDWTKAAQNSVDECLTNYRKHWPALLDERLHRVEAKRLQRALEEWLLIDSQRQMPFVNLAQEKQKTLQLGPLELELRVDRIDRLEGDGAAIIDYKGGQPHKPQEWFGERPKEPQLPLYALALNEVMPIKALVFGNLKPGKRGYRGIALEDELIPGAKTLAQERLAEPVTWDSMLLYWRDGLGSLAAAYAAGDARVDPRDVQVCQYCAFTSLCRIHARQQTSLHQLPVAGSDAE